MVQNMACETPSSPASPKSCSGLSASMPRGPSAKKLSGSQPERANDGRSRVYAQRRKPALSPTSAPLLLPPFQKIPPSTAGANCATAAKDTRPVSYTHLRAHETDSYLV